MWKKLAQETSSSNFQKDVSARLKEMGIEHVEEFLAEEGLFSIDIAFSGPNGMRVAMEVDGPFHYTCNTNQPMGHTLLRWDPSGLLFSGPPPPRSQQHSRACQGARQDRVLVQPTRGCNRAVGLPVAWHVSTGSAVAASHV